MIVPRLIIPASGEQQVARHEAGHAVVAWYLSVPFELVSLGRVPGTNTLGGLMFDRTAAQVGLVRLTGIQPGQGNAFVAIAAMNLIAELVDVSMNGINGNDAALRAGAPIHGHAMDGDYAALEAFLDQVHYPAAQRDALRTAGRDFGRTLLDHSWFRDAIQAVATELVAQRRLYDVQVAAIADHAVAGRVPAPPVPQVNRGDVAMKAYAFWDNGGRTEGKDQADWYTAEKGFRFAVRYA